MALPLITPDMDIVTIVLGSPSIDALFRTKYNEIYTLVHNPETEKGIIKALAAAGVIKYGSGSMQIDENNAGQNAQHTWKEYGAKLKQWLKTHVNSDAKFEKARQVLAWQMFENHRLKYPYWPSCAADAEKSENPKQTIVIDAVDMYDWNNYTLIWAATGDPWVRDVCERTGKSSFRYYCEISGRLELFVLSMDAFKLKKFNAMIKKTPEQWEQLCITFKDEQYSVENLNKTFLELFAKK